MRLRRQARHGLSSSSRPQMCHLGGKYGEEIPSCWCERGDSNPHGLPRQILSLVRLPISPLSHSADSLHSQDYDNASEANSRRSRSPGGTLLLSGHGLSRAVNDEKRIGILLRRIAQQMLVQRSFWISPRYFSARTQTRG
jgi:hypothetical protein